MKFKLILITVLAFASSMAYAQGIVSNLSIGAGFEGIFPSSTFTRKAAESSAFNGSTQSSTNSVGAMASARYDFGRHSAVDFSFTLNRNTELFYSNATGFLSHVQTNNAELIGSYIFRLPSNEHVKPYALFGGGMVRFSPNNNFSAGSTLPQVTTKPAFAYGFGTDFTLSAHWAIRAQYRGLLRADPDFKLSTSDVNTTFGTALRSHVAEPSIQLVYHF